MAEETPAIIDLTVVWRPQYECEFRVDWVTCEAGSRSAALNAAADIYVTECGDEDVTIESALESYDLIAIFEGRPVEHLPSC